VLIQAVARLRSQGRAVTCLLVGDGGRRAQLERLAHKAGVARHVIFAGNVPFDEIAGHYAQIDLFVVPRVDDRAARMVSPLKPFEAMAMRVPLLVSDLPALSEIVGAGERGEVFRAGDAAALAAAAAGLMGDDRERRRFVESAAAWVTAERSWTGVADAFGEVYDALLDDGLGGTAREQAPALVAEPAPAAADTTAEEVRAC
jgi:glycosyltransferase involved in cell wall biosynthesis